MARKRISETALHAAADIDGAVDYIPIVDPSEAEASARNKRSLLNSIADWIVKTATSFLQSGSGAIAEDLQTAVRRWCWAEQYGAVGDGATDDYAAIVRGWTAGFKHVRLMAGKNYKINTGFTFTEGSRLIGEGKSNTTLTLGADIIPFNVTDVNDSGAEHILVVAHAAQTQPILRITANAVSVTRNNFDDIQVSAVALNFNPIHLRATGAFGVWMNNMRRWSLSGVGTVAKFETTAVNGWVNSNTLEGFLVGDFIIGADFANSAGDGGSYNICKDWALQASSRTTHGFRIPDSSAFDNQRNLFDGFTVYDIPVGGVYCEIGTGVIGTEIRPPEGPAFSETQLFLDKGVRTRFTGSPRFGNDLLNQGRWLSIPTNAGWTAAVTGSGATAVQIAYNQVQTGTTLNSTARRYTEPMNGFGAAALFGIDYSQPVVLRFALSRATAEAHAVGRVQLKPTQAEGALVGKGIGVRVSDLALYGESYGSAGAFVDLSVT
ncbi:MAG: hypothetical protein Q7R45_14380, partial [Sulfuricaulis sp.]|nr:hypothetical protein [Sulfuricaulis sp.]